MMRRRVLLAAAVTAVMVAGFLPVSAGPYSAHIHDSTAALVGSISPDGTGLRPVKLADGSQAIVFLVSRETSEARGFFVWPEPDPRADPALPPEYLGCIFVFNASQFDGGCQISPPAYITTDPAFNETTLILTVYSARPDGFRLTANVVLEGTGNASPAEAHGFTVKPEPPATTQLIFAEGYVGLVRTARAMGSVRSQLIGGGAIVPSTQDDSSMMRGLFRMEADPQKGTFVIRPGIEARFDAKQPVCVQEPPPPGQPPPDKPTFICPLP